MKNQETKDGDLFTETDCRLHLGNCRQDICEVCRACEFNRKNPNKNIEGWEKELQKIFDNIYYYTEKRDEEKIKSFIRNLLSAQREQLLKGKFYDKVEIHEEINIPKEIVEKIKSDQREQICKEIEGLQKKAIENPMMEIKDGEISEMEAYNSVYNQAITQVLNLINSSK